MKKRYLTLAIAIIAMMCMLTGCAEKFTCDGCGKEVKSEKHTIEWLGKEMALCDDCYDDYKELTDSASKLIEGLSDDDDSDFDLGDFDLDDFDDDDYSYSSSASSCSYDYSDQTNYARNKSAYSYLYGMLDK